MTRLLPELLRQRDYRLLWTAQDETIEQTDLIEQMIAFFSRDGAPLTAELFARQCDACLAHDTLDLVPLLRTPSLVLVGEDDILTPPRYARALAAALPAGEVMLVPATGHACFLETPKPCTERMLRFLAKHPLG